MSISVFQSLSHFPPRSSLVCAKKGEQQECPLCSAIAEDAYHLGNHLMTHSARSNTCPLCSKTFNQKGSLRTHLRSHTGERPYACDVCGERFSHKHVLNNHKLLHTGEQPFKCPGCGKGFVQKINMRLHAAKCIQSWQEGCDV